MSTKPDRAVSLPAKKRTTQVEGPGALSVVVRWGPVRTVVNGTLVARSARTTFMGPGSVGTSSTARWVSTLVTPGRWQGRRPAAEITWDPPAVVPPRSPRFGAGVHRYLRFLMPAVTIRAHQRLAVPGAVRTQLEPSGCGPCAVEPVLRYHCDRTDALARPCKAGGVRDGFVHTYRR